MPADVPSLCRSFIPNNPRLADIIVEVCKETYRARFLPKTLIRLLVNRAMQEIRKSGNEFIRDPEFPKQMAEHARSLHGRYRGEIAMLNSNGQKRRLN